MDGQVVFAGEGVAHNLTKVGQNELNARYVAK